MPQPSTYTPASTVPDTDIEGQQIADFRIITAGMRAFRVKVKGADGTEREQMRLDCTGSSDCEDLGGDKMALSALEQMTKVAGQNMTVFMNHKYTVPDSVFGSIDSATLKERVGEDGHVYVDLDLGIVVEEQNSKAVETWKYIENGRKLGISIGCMVNDWKWIEVKGHPYGGYYSITDIYPIEFSVVGIPANQRSWVHNAVKSLNAKRRQEARAKQVSAMGYDPSTSTVVDPLIELDQKGLKPEDVSEDGSISEQKQADPAEPAEVATETKSAPVVPEAPVTPPATQAPVTVDLTNQANEALARFDVIKSKVDEAEGRLTKMVATGNEILEKLQKDIAAAVARCEELRKQADALEAKVKIVATSRMGRATQVANGVATTRVTKATLKELSPLEAERMIEEELSEREPLPLMAE